MANYLKFGHQTTGIGQGLLHNDESQSLPSGGSPGYLWSRHYKRTYDMRSIVYYKWKVVHL